MYKVEIKDSNKFFTLKGKQIRSPFIINVHDSEIQRIKSLIKFNSVISYNITHYKDNEIKVDKSNFINNDIKKEKNSKEIDTLDISSIQMIPIMSKPEFHRDKIKLNDTLKEDIIKNKSIVETETNIEELSIKTSPILEELFKKYQV